MRAQFETNFFGAVKVMKDVIPIMRNQRNGKIVNITSMGGRIAIPCHSVYHGTKFALESLSEYFWKNMKTANTTKPSESADSPYSQMKIKISESLKRTVQNAMHPSEVAKAILEAITSDNPEFRYLVGKDATMTIEARKICPIENFKT
jgi:short-subunit dehydrogenase